VKLRDSNKKKKR